MRVGQVLGRDAGDPEQSAAAIRWLSDAVVKLDQDSPETPAALAAALSRLLIVCVFGATARELGGGPRVA